MRAASGVGFSEIRIPGVTVSETIQLPSDLLRSLGNASLSHRLTIVLTRDRVSPLPPRSDPELAMNRQLLAAHGPLLLAQWDGTYLGPHPRQRDRLPARRSGRLRRRSHRLERKTAWRPQCPGGVRLRRQPEDFLESRVRRAGPDRCLDAGLAPPSHLLRPLRHEGRGRRPALGAHQDQDQTNTGETSSCRSRR